MNVRTEITNIVCMCCGEAVKYSVKDDTMEVDGCNACLKTEIWRRSKETLDFIRSTADTAENLLRGLEKP